MKTEKLFHELLGLGMNWEVQECEFDHIQGVVRIKIAETAHLWEMERSPGEGLPKPSSMTIRKSWFGDISMCLNTVARFDAACRVDNAARAERFIESRRLGKD